MINVYIVDINKFDYEKTNRLLPKAIRYQAENFKLEKKRKEYLASQWLRYHVLSEYLACDWKLLQFSYTQKGRPYLSDYPELDFNISHSKHYVVMALTKGQRVGIDIQTMKEKIDVLSIAKHYFSDCEYQWLCQLNEDQQLQRFYWLWTYKEASLKLTGDGIANGLSEFKFTMGNKEEKPLELLPEVTKKLFYYSMKLDHDTLLCIAYEQSAAKYTILRL
ncbi:4'-phosphopantetheinyl transferase family protein [Fastidiosibacter lacustris]|uniref:4'-phosphopantetheinyl transferase family protein n=1 Tax=Fastidiosibacter lacustris TaxID=2056695 RepID=UPI000E343BFE|nr:4'-phosphopantetheinyl transferase superfamily protein [Fastidiosibacter lacustris]